MRIEPAWVGEALLAWKASEWSGPRSQLGYPAAASFAPMPDADDGSVGGISAIEIRAMAAAIDWLALAHPDHWMALQAIVRPRMASEVNQTPAQALRAAQRVQECGPLLAGYIDRVLG